MKVPVPVSHVRPSGYLPLVQFLIPRAVPDGVLRQCTEIACHCYIDTNPSRVIARALMLAAVWQAGTPVWKTYRRRPSCRSGPGSRRLKMPRFEAGKQSFARFGCVGCRDCNSREECPISTARAAKSLRFCRVGGERCVVGAVAA